MRIHFSYALVALSFGACFLKAKSPSEPRGDIDVVVTNRNPFPVCTVDIISSEANDLPLYVVSETGKAPEKTLPPGKTTHVGVRKGQYLVEASACDNGSSGHENVAVDGATHVYLGGAPYPKAPAGYVAVHVPMLRSGGSFEEPAGGGGGAAEGGGGGGCDQGAA
jgi:hypothetical protein